MSEELTQTEQDLLRVGLSATDNTMLVTVAGELDMLTAHGLCAAVDHAISKADGRPVIIDLNGLLFIGSHGVAALERAAASARCGNVALRVVIGPGRPARRILELTGMDRMLTVCDTVGEAP